MYLALDNLQRLICNKPKQPLKHTIIMLMFHYNAYDVPL